MGTERNTNALVLLEIGHCQLLSFVLCSIMEISTLQISAIVYMYVCRYKLAATQSKSVGTQVDLLESEKKSNPESKENVAEQDIASLQAEKNVC